MTVVVVQILKGLSLIVLAAAVPGFLLLMVVHLYRKQRGIPTFTLTSVHAMRGGPSVKNAA